MKSRRSTSRQKSKHGHGNGQHDWLVDLFSSVGVEGEKIFRRLIHRTEIASRGFRHNLDDLMDLVNGGLTHDIGKQGRRLAKDLLAMANHLELLPLRGLKQDRIVRQAKKNLTQITKTLQKSPWFDLALNTVGNTRAQVLTFLKIPTEGDVSQLKKKISTLEKKVNELDHPAA